MPIRGYGNMARRMGHHYQRLELPDGSYVSPTATQAEVAALAGTRSGGKSKSSLRPGSIVDPSQLLSTLTSLMDSISMRPSCFLASVVRSPL